MDESMGTESDTMVAQKQNLSSRLSSELSSTINSSLDSILPKMFHPPLRLTYEKGNVPTLDSNIWESLRSELWEGLDTAIWVGLHMTSFWNKRERDE